MSGEMRYSKLAVTARRSMSTLGPSANDRLDPKTPNEAPTRKRSGFGAA
jgi:hypothetical protein